MVKPPVTGISITSNATSVDVGKTLQFNATLTPADGTGTVEWFTSNSNATINKSTGALTGASPGSCDVTAKVNNITSNTITVSVNGIKLNTTSLPLIQGNSSILSATAFINGASSTAVTWTSNNTGVANVSNGTVTANGGTGAAIITAAAGNYTATCTVTVSSNTAANINAGSAAVDKPMRFSAIRGDLNTQCYRITGQDLSYITVSFPQADLNKGIVYKGYVSQANQGTAIGVGSERFYYTASGSNPLIDGLAFVPKDGVSGTVTMNYQGVSTGGKSFSGTIQVTVNRASDVSYSTSAKVPLTFTVDSFNKVAQSRPGGRNISTMRITTLPASSQGTLYYNYRGSNVYDSLVARNTDYKRSGTPNIGGITFVPNATYTGTVSIPYSAQDEGLGTYTGTITITVSGGAASGDVNYTVNAGSYVNFNATDFNSVCRTATKETLDYVNFSLPSSGTLYYNYRSNGNYDHAVTTGRDYYYNGGSSYDLDDVYYVAKSSSNSTVSFNFTGYSIYGSRFTGTVTITVKGGADGDLTYSTPKNTAVTFDPYDFNQASRDYKGNNLDYVRFTLPSSSRGTLYYNYKSSSNTGTKVGSSTNYYYSSPSPYLENVTFEPYSGYTGTVSIDFRGWDSKGNQFDGVVTVKVGATSGDISYSVAKNSTVTFKTTDFNDYCKDENGYNLDYVQFTLPSSSKGTLYHNYKSSSSTGTKTSSSTKYYRTGTSPYISDVTFVPANNYTGTVDIDFTGRDVDGDTIRGTVSIQVGSGGVNKTNVSYSTAKNSTVSFRSDDFNQASRNNDDYNLSYVTFDLPSSNRGTLYLNYRSSSSTGTKVSGSTKYYRNDSPSLDNITFVPYNNYTGTVEFSYTGWDTNNSRFTGTVTIYVGSSGISSVVPYKTTLGRPVVFDNNAFDVVSRAYDDNNFDYVRFTLPSASVGTLYYDYRSGANLNNPVKANTNYYRGGSPYLYSITFVPATGFVGTAEIPFTAWDTDGQQFDGKVSIIVEQAVAATIRYTVANGAAARLQQNDFNNVARALMNEDVVKVRFTPPNASYGTLYYGYSGPGAYDGQMSVATDCYTTKSPYLSQVAFVPAGGFAGAVSIPYYAENANGYGFAGTVEITVQAASNGRFSDMAGFEWAATAVEYLYQNGVVKGTSDTQYSPKGPTSRGDFALMITRAFKFSGTGGQGFSDVPAGSYYAEAITTARTLGIVQGDGATFRPNQPVTRQDALVMLQRAMRAAGKTVADGSSGDLARFQDGGSVAGYAVGAVGAMVRQGVVQGDNGNQLNPTAFITRAEMAVILYRALNL